MSDDVKRRRLLIDMAEVMSHLPDEALPAFGRIMRAAMGWSK